MTSSASISSPSTASQIIASARNAASFLLRAGTVRQRQRFCTTDCRLTFQRERQRAQRTALYAGPTALSATERPAPNEEASEREDSFVLMGQQDFIEVAWDRHGNLLLRRDPLFEGEQELCVSRDYFPRFLQALDVLRELIAEAIREGEAS